MVSFPSSVKIIALNLENKNVRIVIFGFRFRVRFACLKLLSKCLKSISPMATQSWIGIGEHTIVKKH